MDRCPTRLVHQKVAPAQPTAVMKLRAPRASAPPKATPKSRRAPDPCSVKAQTRPGTITATVARPDARANDDHHHVHRLGHEAWLRRDAGLLDEAVKTQEGRGCAVGVHRGDPSGVARVPGLEERQRFPTPDFTHDDAIRAETHRDPDQPGEVRHVTRMELDGVPCLALELARVLEDHDPLRRVAECDDLADKGIRERGLTRSGASGD